LFRLWLLAGIVSHGDGYAVSAKAASDFIVYSCVAASSACMPDAGYFPLVAVCAYDLGVTRNNNERRLSLRSVDFGYEVEEAFAKAYALVIRQNHQAVHTVVSCPHVNMHNRYEPNWLILVNRNVAPRMLRQRAA
jgi:hypothetical protein